MDISRFEERLASLEVRLSKIERRIYASSQPQADCKGNDPWYRTSSSPSPQKNQEPAQTRESSQGNWLGVIAILCFVLAAGFIIKLSIDSGWLTPIRQIGLASLLGFGLIGTGLFLTRADREYASFLPSAGIIILYLAVFAAHRVYSLLPFETAIGMTALISGFCVWLYTEIKHDVYPLTAAAGAYIAPVVLGFNAHAVFALYYFLFCTMAFAAISVWLRTRTLTIVAAYMAMLMTFLIGLDLRQDVLIAGFLALHFLFFAFGTYLHTRQSGMPLAKEEAWAFLPVLLLFYAAEYYLIDRIQPGLAPWASLAFAGILIGLYLSAKKYVPEGLNSQSLILSFATVVCFHSVYLELLPDSVRPWLFVVIMMSIAFSPITLAAESRDSPFYVPALALLAILANEYLTMMSHLLEENSTSWLAVSFASVASFWFVLAKKNGLAIKRETHSHIILGAAHLLAILGLYRLTTNHGSLAVSASWLFYAIGIIFFAFTRKDEVMAKSALFVLGFAAGKALLYDAASAPTIVRIFCLLLTGAVLYGCGFFMRQTASWNSGKEQPSPFSGA